MFSLSPRTGTSTRGKRSAPARLSVAAAVLVVTLATLASDAVVRARRGSAADEGAQTAALLQLPLRANDLVYDPVSQRIYASVGAAGGERANTVTPINPATGTLEAGIAVGSDPARLALSDGGQYLYVGLDGEGNVRRIDLPTRTPGLQFSLGPGGRAQDIAVMPGRPGSAVISKVGGSGVAVYDEGVARPRTLDQFEVCNDVETNEAGTLVYCHNSQNSESGLRKLSVGDDGLTLVSRAFNLLLYLPGMRYQAGRIFARSGEVIDAEAMAGVGRFQLPSHGYAVAPDVANNRVYFIANTETGFNKYLLAFDLQTSLLVGKLTLSAVSGDPASLIRWGATGLAFRTTGGQVFLLNTTDIPAPPATPLPTPAQVAPGVLRLPLATGDLAYDPATQKVYASLPSRAGSFGNSVAPLDPATGTAATPVPVGGEPGKLGIFRGGRHLYVGLDGPGHVRRFDTLSQAAGAAFPVGSGPNGTQYARDIEVSPDDPDVVAVARFNRVVSPSGEGVAIYAGGVKRAAEITRNEFVNVIEYSADGSTLYGYDNGSTENFLYRLAVDSSGVTVTRKTGVISGAGDIRFEAGRLYATNGQIADPEAFKVVGSFAAVGPVLPDAVSGRAYVLARSGSQGGATLYAFDLHTFLPLGYLEVPGVSGYATSLVRAGVDALAFRTTGDQVYFLSLSALNAYNPPAPGPVPRGDGVRQVQLIANDFAYNPADGQFYASVPSYAGAPHGNSITTVDPSTGAVGAPAFVGSEPDVLALSTDGRQLYAALDGAASVRRFDTASKTPGLTFDLGRSNDPTVQHHGPRYARALAVVPGSPGSVAVARYYPAAGYGDGVYVYDDGVARRRGAYGSHIEFAETGELLAYNGDNTEFGFRKYSLAVDGFDETARAVGVMRGFGTKFDYAAGRAYATDGSVVDTSGGLSRLGRFVTPGGRLVATSDADHLVYYISSYSAGGAFLIEAYDKSTLIQVAAGRLQGVPNGLNAVKFVRYGAAGLALLTSNGQLFFFQTSMVQPLGATPAPAPVQVAEGVLRLPLTTNDIAYDRVSGKIYASVPSRATSDRPSIENTPGTPYSFGNSVVPVDPLTGTLGAPVYVGSEPEKLAASKDGQFLYASLKETGEVRRVHLPTRTAGLRFPLILSRELSDGFFSELPRPTDMEVVPGRPGSLAVARWSRAVVYDEGVARTETNNLTGLERTPSIEFSSTPSLLYGLDNETSDFGLYRMSVDAAGVRVTSKTRGLFQAFGADMKFDAGRIYTTTGKVIDGQTMTVVGQFPGMGEVTQSGLVVPDSAVNRVFFLKRTGGGQTLTIVAYDMTTLQQTGTLTVPNPSGGDAASFLRWGADGFAFRTYEAGPTGPEGRSLYLVRALALVPPRVAGPSSLQFDAAAKSVVEGTWEVTVRVTRTGDTADAATVTYETADGTATAASDYTTALGTLRFEPGETEKSFPVLITTDAHAEPDETFTVTLRDASGASLGSPHTLTVTVVNGGLPPGPSPVRWDAFNTFVFVRQHYSDFLNRSPDPAGLSFWAGEINSCGADVLCQEAKRVNVSAAFFLSIEFQETGYLAYRAYKAAYGDLPGRPVPIRMNEFLFDTREMGEGVVVGPGNWRERLEFNKRAYFERLAASPRFAARHPGGTAPEAFVAALDQNAGGVLTPAERAALATELAAAGNTTQARAATLRRVAESPELARRELNRAFVLMQYFGYLRRNPDAAPDSNFDGYNFWLQKLDSFGGNFVSAEMVKAFITSVEYTRRFDLRPSYRGRLAPSPTGYLHLGHARTFWTAYERALAAGGRLVLRDEDLDPARSRAEFARAMLEDLRWLGVEWQEGPDVGGPFAPYRQSEARTLYLEAWERLVAGGFVYPCTCSRKDIARAAGAPHESAVGEIPARRQAEDDEPHYPGTCRPAAPGRGARRAGGPASLNWRFRVPDGEEIVFEDARRGASGFVAGRDFGDFAVWRRDDVPAYQLAVVVDDARMRITEVVRGADLLKSTARQILLQRALGFPTPAYYHCDLVTDERGERLAKRHESLSLRALRADGLTPEEVRRRFAADDGGRTAARER